MFPIETVAPPNYGLEAGYVIGVIDPENPTLQLDIARFAMMTTYEDTGELFEDLTPEEQAECAALIVEKAEDDPEDFTFFGVFHKGSMVGLGYVSVLEHREDMSTLRGIAVDKAHEHKGVGSALVQYAEDIIKVLEKRMDYLKFKRRSNSVLSKIGISITT